MPRDLGDSSLDWVRVLENHNGFSADGLRHVLWLLTGEVFFKDVELVVLSDASSSSGDEILRSGAIAEGRLLVKSPHVLLDFCWLRVIELGGPATDLMGHTSVLSWDSLSVDLNSNVASETLRVIHLLCARTSVGCYRERLCLGFSRRTHQPLPGSG